MAKPIPTRVHHGMKQKLVQDIYRCPKCGWVTKATSVKPNEGRWVDDGKATAKDLKTPEAEAA